MVGNGFGGVLLHEAVGHGLEADAVQKDASVYAGRLGEQVAPEFVTAYDDGSRPNAWGSEGVDDEGTPTRRTTVIEEGRLTSYLYDLLRARKDGVESTGNGRRESFRHLPMPRMTNTFFAPGDATPEELIGGVERGLYAVSFGGGQVEPATGDFVFGVSEGYLIENGKVTAPVRGATLVGNGLEALRAIDGIAGDLEIATGYCGKGGQTRAGRRGPAARPDPRAHRGRHGGVSDLERLAAPAAPSRPRVGRGRVGRRGVGRGVHQPARARVRRARSRASATPAAAGSACARSSDGRAGYAYGTDLSDDGRARSWRGAAREAAELADADEYGGPARRARHARDVDGLASPRARATGPPSARSSWRWRWTARPRARRGRDPGREHRLLGRARAGRARQLARLRRVVRAPPRRGRTRRRSPARAPT